MAVLLLADVGIANSNENKLNAGLNDFKATVGYYGFDYNDEAKDYKIDPKRKMQIMCVYDNPW